ncbi:transmembrane protein PVRIG [Pteronotus mesoamericanus]|uniref:transmembrane protein PVRIG n=1 Tax=Pteronotus mesoamericanus TaxID=1884717 RepID=UPI0023EE28C6|nr:transmembrane protein PVRIG [Pteronotus parnellii mesoamericanus]
MGRPRALVLLLALLTLCITAGTPEVWVQVQMEATKSPSFTIRCGLLGSSFISQVTVDCRGPNGPGGTKLAVLDSEFGTKKWPPAHQVYWETRTSVSLTLEESEGRSPSPNTTFCCKFTSFPEGSQEACGNLLGTDQELPAPSAAPILRADLAGILAISGILLLGCIYLLYMLHWQKHRSVMKLQPPLRSALTESQARAASQTSLASLHIPYATIATSYFCPADLDTVLPPQPLSRWAPIPTHTAHQPACWAPLPASACSSFISIENGLYVQTGERPPHIRSNFIPFSDPLGPRAKEGHIGVQRGAPSPLSLPPLPDL